MRYVTDTEVCAENGVLYAAVIDSAYKLNVWCYSGGVWKPLGNPAVDQSVANVCLRVYQGVPFVAYTTTSGTNSSTLGTGRIAVIAYVGGNWRQLGSANFSGQKASFPSLAVNESGVYLSYKEFINAESWIAVRHYDTATNSWGAIGSGRLGNNVQNSAIGVEGGTPYLVYSHIGTNNFQVSATVLLLRS